MNDRRTFGSDAFWREFELLNYHQDGHWGVVRVGNRNGAVWRPFLPFMLSDWRKRAEYRRWLKRWGLK